MEPTMLPVKKTRTFRSEAEYRLWQHELVEDARPTGNGKGLVSRIVNNVRGWATQEADTPRKQRVNGRAAKQRA